MIRLQIIYIITKQNLAVNNRQELINHKTQPKQNKSFIVVYRLSFFNINISLLILHFLDF